MENISQVVLEKKSIRIIFKEEKNHLSQLFEIRDGGVWSPVIGSAHGIGTLIFKRRDLQHSIPLHFKSQNESGLVFESDKPEIKIKLEIVSVNDNLFHIKYDISSKKKFKFTKLIANYSILLGSDPEYTWIPHIRPQKDYVVGDHVFRSPVIIYKKGKFTFALFPDLDVLRDNRPCQSIMDLDLISGDNEPPQVSYGFGNYKPVYHVFFPHNPKKTSSIKAKSDISISYYVKLYNDVSVAEVLKDVNGFLWEKYGRKLVYNNCNPQVLSYDTYVREGFKAMLERHRFWGDFTIESKECGGIFLHSYLGKNKKPITFIPPEEYDNYKEGKMAPPEILDTFVGKVFKKLSANVRAIKFFDTLLPKFAKRHAEIRNNAWFLNIRTGYSLRYFGELWKDENFKEKGRKFFNTVMSLPRLKGAFPALILPASPNANRVSYVNGLKAHIFSDDYGIVDISLAMFWAIKYFRDFGDDDALKEKCKELADLIKELQLENGAIATYFNFKGGKPQISDDLIDSASSGAPLMFLTEYYKISNDATVIPIAEKIAKFLLNEIIPEDKWHDFEPFYSCTNLPKNIYDNYTKSHVMNNLCIYWCADGLKELYNITKKEEYLKLGERVLAILSLFQQVWNMSYIDFNTFGGFGVQNADAELSDARQAIFIRTYMEYYLLTGKKEYMERGIAALRASFALMLLREQEEQCPGNLKDWNTIDGIDRGSMYENYGHSGINRHCSPFILTDWGIGSSASAAAYVKKHFGDLFLDFKEKNAWGIDGIVVKSSNFKDNKVEIEMEKILDKKFVLIKARDAPTNKVEVIINKKGYGSFNQEDLLNGIIV